LVENGHELHYRGHDATMRSDDPNWDWLIRGTMVYPQRTGMSHMTLQMATKQW
jgi:hypothetical protein